MNSAIERGGIKIVQKSAGTLRLADGSVVPCMEQSSLDAVVGHSASLKAKFETLYHGITAEIAAYLNVPLYEGFSFANALGFRRQLQSRKCPFYLKTKGREHKSNHIRIVVLLRPGHTGAEGDVTDAARPSPVWYIICSDEESCGRWRGERKPIPNYETKWKALVDEYLIEWDAQQTVECNELFSFLELSNMRGGRSAMKEEECTTTSDGRE